MKSYLLLLCLTAFHVPSMALIRSASGGELQQPDVMVNNGIDYNFNIEIDYANITTDITLTFNTRVFEGTLPGPTIYVKKGKTMVINFENKMTQQEGSSVSPNGRSFPDESNIYLHGLHVSGDQPANDPTVIVKPQGNYRYEYAIPSDHSGGTHWVHPYRHGSSSLQVGGGAAMVMIVEDDDGEVPDEVAQATDVIMMVQDFSVGDLNDFALESGDGIFKLEATPDVESFRLVNGEYQPSHTINVGEWHRWRVVWGTYNNDALNLSINDEGCEMVLLAKDGIYINDYPRQLKVFPIPPGGRADIMVRCESSGMYDVTHFDEQLLFTVEAIDTEDEIPIVVLDENFDFRKPSYLKDLTDEMIVQNCICETELDNDAINDKVYNPTNFRHKSPIDTVVERFVKDVSDHPYHQNVHPFQLSSNFLNPDLQVQEADIAYFKPGDYHDSLFVESLVGGEAEIRFQTTDFEGRMTIFCEKLKHSDAGMRSAELVEGSVCGCGQETEGGIGFTRTPTQAPVSPTQAPVPPTQAPVPPTRAPASPTRAPVPPTRAPASPTRAPISAQNLDSESSSSDEERASSDDTGKTTKKKKVKSNKSGKKEKRI